MSRAEPSRPNGCSPGSGARPGLAILVECREDELRLLPEPFLRSVATTSRAIERPAHHHQLLHAGRRIGVVEERSVLGVAKQTH